MRHCLHWRHSIVGSVILHSLLLVGIGWLSPLSPAAQAPEQYIEMELADNTGPVGGGPASVSAASSIPSAYTTAIASPMPAARGPQTDTASNTDNSADGTPVGGYDSLGGSGVASDGGIPGGSGTASEGTGGMTSGNAASASSTSAASSAIQPPRILQRVSPDYPEQARREGWEGKVVLRLEVLPNGTAGDISIVRSSGYALLDEAAIEAVSQWRFIPAKDSASGMPIRCVTTVPLVFRLS